MIRVLCVLFLLFASTNAEQEQDSRGLKAHKLARKKKAKATMDKVRNKKSKMGKSKMSKAKKESKKAPGKGKGKEMPGKQEKDEDEAITPNVRWAQLGPRPFWLVDEMKDSFLKDELGKASSCVHLNSELIS